MTKFILLLLSFFYCTFVFAAPIKVEIDRNPVNLNESFQIEFSTTEDPDANPIFTPLEKDFEIINQNHSSQSSWVNGHHSSVIKWTFTVIAKRAGEITIPALQFGSETSPEKTVIINKLQKPVSQNNATLFIEVDVDNPNPYIQSQVIYRLRFFQREQIAEAKLNDLELPDAVVEKLGDSKKYKTQVNGKTYLVSELNYAIFPQKSGVMEIPPATIIAAVMAGSNSGFNGFFGSYSTRRETIVSKAIELNVQPIPENIDAKTWLVSEDVYLEQTWSNEEIKVNVGEPLTRTLKILAKGVMGSQLPQLHNKNIKIPNLKSYPDKPNINEQKDTTGIVGLREEKVAFIASKTGTYTLPEIKVSWFNLRTGKQQTSTIPETTITVVAAAGETLPQTPTTTSEQQTTTKKIAEQPAIKTIEKQVDNPLWQWLSLFFGLAWLLTLALFVFYKPKNKQPAIEINNELELKEKAFIKALKKACTENDTQKTKDLLIQWGKTNYQVTSLGALANFCDARLHNEILELNAILYSATEKSWQGKALYQAFAEHKAMSKINSKTPDALEPLYKI